MSELGAPRMTGPDCRAQRTAIARASMRSAWLLPLILLFSVTCFAQGVFKKTEKSRLAPNQYRVNRRTAVPFKPFDMVDFRTGRPIAPSASMTLADGRTVTAKQFFDQLNEFEKWLNDNGYSLRTEPPNSRIAIEELVVNRAKLERQRQMAPKPTRLPRRENFFSTYSHNNLATPKPVHIEANHFSAARVNPTITPQGVEVVNNRITAAGINGVVRDGLVVDTPSLAQISRENLTKNLPQGAVIQPPQPPPSTVCTKVEDSKHWPWEFGDQGTFYAYADATLELTGQACKPPDMANFNQNNSEFFVQAEAKAGGTVFGAGGDLIRVMGNFGGNQVNNTVIAGLGVFVVGETVLDLHKSAVGSWGAQDNLSYPAEISVPIVIPLGPIDIDVKLGAQGSVGLQYSVSLYPTSASVSAVPSATTAAYAQAGVGIYIGSFGVGGSLNPFLAWNMDLGASAGIGWLGGFYVYDDLYADCNLNMLVGKFWLFLKLGIGPFSEEWDVPLWDEPGLQFNAVLVDVKTNVPLNW